MFARLAAALLVAGVLAGCSSPAVEVAPTGSAASATPTAEASATAADPDGTAEGNLSLFDATVEPLTPKSGLPKGRTVINALEAAGFDPAAMEFTPDKTAIGLDADSIEFSVKINGECIIGQFGSFGYRSVVMPLLASDTCLVGKTKDIG